MKCVGDDKLGMGSEVSKSGKIFPEQVTFELNFEMCVFSGEEAGQEGGPTEAEM